MKASKQEAKEMYEKMIQQRIEACTTIYEDEFENLAKQFEKI
jgi:hypothetical protein